MNTDAIIYNKLIDPLLSGLRKLIKSMISENTSLVDIASGTGELVLSLAGHCNEMIGIDLEAHKVDYCNGRLIGEMNNTIQFKQINALDLSANLDKKYDYSCMSMALHQFHTSERAKIIDEALKVSDTLIIADYNNDLPKGFKHMLVFFIERIAGKEHYTNFKSFRKEGGVRGIIAKNGYKLVSEVHASSKVFAVYRVKNS